MEGSTTGGKNFAHNDKRRNELKISKTVSSREEKENKNDKRGISQKRSKVRFVVRLWSL